MPPEFSPLKLWPTYRNCGPEKGRSNPPATFFHAQPREYVKTPTYFGPDRRRVTKKWDAPERRKNPPSPATAAAAPPDVEIAGEGEAEAGLSQAELDALFD